MPDFDSVIENAIRAVKREMGITSHLELSVMLCDDKEIKKLNFDFRGKNKPTNVLAFPSEEQDYLGDIAISLETIKREAKNQGKKPEHHLTHMVIHGTLHLLGLDHEDETDALRMESIEINVLTGLGIDNPYVIK